MTQKYPHLCAPITLGRVNFRNRMFSAPMGGTDITADCCVGPRTPGFYELRAKGGAAAVTARAAQRAAAFIFRFSEIRMIRSFILFLSEVIVVAVSITCPADLCRGMSRSRVCP